MKDLRYLCYIVYSINMLVFKNNKWHMVNLPSYIDPSWGFGDRQRVASIMLKWLQKGLNESEAFMKAEEVLLSAKVLAI